MWPELLTRLISEMRPLGAQLSRQQGPSHVPASSTAWSGEANTFPGCVRAQGRSPTPASSTLPAFPLHFTPSPALPFPAVRSVGKDGGCAQRAGIYLLLGSLEAPLGPRSQMDGLGEMPAESTLETSPLALLSAGMWQGASLGTLSLHDSGADSPRAAV